MKKSIWFWLCFVLGVIFAVYFSVRIIMTTMGHGNAAIIKSISISADSGNKNLAPVAAAVGISPGTRTYSVKLIDVLDRVSAVPGVKSASVRRLPNGNLTIRVKMHRAVAAWTDGTNFFPVSGDGTVINAPLPARPQNIVIFKGALPNNISEIAKVGMNIVQYIDYLEWIENRRWNIHTTGNITILLPEEDPAAAIGAVVLLDKNHKILSRDITVLDMRDPARILVKE